MFLLKSFHIFSPESGISSEVPECVQIFLKQSTTIILQQKLEKFRDGRRTSVVVIFTLKAVLTSIQYPSLSYSSRQRNEFPWSQANPK